MPVAYVLVPPGATAKALAAEFARYLGIPAGTRMTQARITEAVCHTYDRAGVRLVLIDETPPPQPPHHHRRGDRRPVEETSPNASRRRSCTRASTWPPHRCSVGYAGPGSPDGPRWSSAGPSPHGSAHANRSKH
ncbi:TniB family NTP-binding protein [Embleya scabrispora]|uniref:TniB family NTP-binding protein n=1 Tax=Embleya scabrispora TaxID=159449 RepID=UPI003CCC2FFC